ncbi:ATPase E1-E2 type family protein [Actinidia rufa]|uniref:ATPase E1-E2 type family protein n=1 Tax=Actinidia rufa TaxID=165716 RepID=A0A7J0GDF9_9ERIC|nr:ATPase E1-E2 type family protein [Actinidia rufa]
MSTNHESSLHGLENFVNQATTSLAQTSKVRWQMAIVAIYCSRVFYSLLKEATSTNTAPSEINGYEEDVANPCDDLKRFDSVEGLKTALEANLQSEINGYEEDVANPCDDLKRFDSVEGLKTALEANLQTLKTDLQSEINGYEEDIANPSEDLTRSDGVEGLKTTVKTNLRSEINGSEEDTANPSEVSTTKMCRPNTVPRCYSTKALFSLGKELCKKFSRARSYTVVDVEPDCFSSIDRSRLCKLVNEKNADLLLQVVGGVEGVITKLKSNAENGIHGRGEDIASRHKSFGSNSYQKPLAKTFHVVRKVVIEAFKDPMILLLLICASLSVGFGTAKHGLSGLTDGGSIFSAIFLVILVFASSNFWSRKEFNKLSQAGDNIQCQLQDYHLFSNTSVSSIHSFFTPFETAKEVWDYLAEQYSSVDGANEYQLGLELHHLRFDSGQTLTDFYNKLSNLWNHLAQFEPTWTCPIDDDAFYAYRDRSRLRHFLMALPPDYEHIRASLLHRHPLPTVGQALAELRSEETRKKTMVYQHSQPKKYCSFCRRDTHSYEDCRSRSKPKHNGYHNRQTAAVTDSSGPSPDSSSSTLTAADVETIVTQVLSRTNLHSSAVSTTSDVKFSNISKTPTPSGLGRPLFTDPSLDIILPVTSPSSAGSPPSPNLPSRIMDVPNASLPAAPPSVPCPPVRCSTRVDVRRNGQPQQIPLFDVVVGDVILLKVGDQVPADGLFLDGQGIKVDESNITGETDTIEVNHSHEFLLSGSKVVDGSARMLVTSVGVNTKWGQIMKEIACDSDEPTTLQTKLKEMTSFIAAVVGILVALMVLVILLIRYFMGNKFAREKTDILHVLNDVAGILATPVVIAAAAIPEGLRLAVNVALAYSTKSMLTNQAIVKKLSACETMASVTTICTDRKGTLTMRHVNRSTPQGLCLNYWRKQFKNGGVKEMHMNVEELRASFDILRVEAMNSEKKQSGVLIRKKVDKKIHMHLKGAPELILAVCSRYHDTTGVIKQISDGAGEKIQKLIQDMATNGIRCIAFAHKEMPQNDDFEGKSPQKLLEDCFILSGFVGLKDPVREAVIECQGAGVTIIMTTEDDMSTARAVATECGIIEQDQDIATVAVEGIEFENYTDQEKMEKVDRIRVMARASPFHKRIMVQCLKQNDHVVAVTGDSTGDAVALREANVGLLSMGTDMAKESSDAVILDNNFVSLVKVLRRGRGIYINIQAFTQFLLTVSITSLVIDSVTAVSASEPPIINIVAAISAGTVPYATLQLLWVKLIVGTLAALALMIEQPTKDVMQKPPVNPREPFITNIMWRNILAQGLYQIAILLTLQFKGESIFNVSTKVKDTMIFNAFVFFHISTIFNARTFEMNIVEAIHRKKLFCGIIGTIIVLQVVMVELLNRFADTERLCWGKWGACLGIAAVSWLIGRLVKFIPVPERPFCSYFFQLVNWIRFSVSG